ncbi:MAG: DUF1571 domain-containing protein [Planctomycetota bacterium]|nr:DUF1571 domain-containing protein [Planctomycetota bacterium]
MRLTALWMGRIVLAAGLAGCIQTPQRAPVAPPVADATNDRLAQRIARDPVGVLQEGLDRYNSRVTSYTCTLHKRERVDPKGPMALEQTMVCKFLEKPFSVYADTVKNPLGARKILYIEGKWDNRMLVEPSGIGILLGFMLIDPRGPQARAETLQSIDQFGFKRSSETLIRSYRMARGEGILTTTLLGTDTLGGRDVIGYEARITEPKPTGRFNFPRVRVWLDHEWLLPIGVDTWDAEGVERGHYRYADVNFQTNLTADDFLPEANGMKSPKETHPTPSSGNR